MSHLALATIAPLATRDRWAEKDSLGVPGKPVSPPRAAHATLATAGKSNDGGRRRKTQRGQQLRLASWEGRPSFGTSTHLMIFSNAVFRGDLNRSLHKTQ